MRKLIITVIILALVILMAGGVAAQGYKHEVTIVLDGEWDLQQRVNTPNSNSTITLVGVGKAEIHSALTEAATWWDLF